MNRQGMIMTVGIGGKEPESLLSALLKSVRDAHPEVLGLIVSADSRPMADQLQERLQEECQIVVFTVQDENDVDLIFSQIVDIIGQLIEKYGVHPQSLRLDFTSGTKAMSAGAILAAVSTGIENLRYIAGERMHGTVQRGLEKIYSLSPTRYLATHDYQTACQYLRGLRYAAALDLIGQVSTAALPESYQENAAILAELIRAYQAWDLFQHREAGTIFAKLPNVPSNMNEFILPRERIADLHHLADAIDPPRPSDKKQYTKEGLADLYNNAQRRILEGKYDDACARLYRLTEMCAQYRLQKKGIDTSRVYETDVPSEKRKEYCFDLRDNKGKRYAKLGLQKSYQLLCDLGDGLGEAFERNKGFNDVLTLRNQSILAHGVKPVDEQTCRDFAKYVFELLLGVDAAFTDICKKMQFPWLT
ncbi:MAG TPA: TIGR02710 family CRISPR-associated CARF protein [bacterium]|nr:TIGR02710 family CRISPR-associated CARF protein [bacterium]